MTEPTAVSSYDVEEILLRVRELVEAGRSMPMSASVLVNRDEMLDLLEAALEGLPEELRQARWLLKERDEFLSEARRDAEDIREKAAATASRMVEEREIVRQAEATARQIRSDAEATARQLRHEAEDYIDTKLASFEVVLERTMLAVQKGRERLQVVVDPSGDSEAEDDEDSAFFDQDDL
ncbi:MAG: synthase [Actinomycetia bacterium]|nr:synthase [Actinomycetes bacterium]